MCQTGETTPIWHDVCVKLADTRLGVLIQETASFLATPDFAEDAKLFRFVEQEKLRREFVDSGLTRAYRSQLERAQRVAEGEGISLGIEVLEGKLFGAAAVVG